MLIYDSEHWNKSYNVCTKHHRSLPCIECINTGDKDLKIIDDSNINEPQNSLDAMGKGYELK